MTFSEWWADKRTKIPTNRGLVSEDVASEAWNSALDEASKVVDAARGEVTDLRQIRDAIRDLKCSRLSRYVATS